MNLKKMIVASGAVLSMGVALADARPLPPTSYSPRGLAALWDAIDNAGIGRHEDSLAEWVDLVGANKITFANSSGPVNAVVTQDPAVQILGDVTASGTCEALSSAREVTVEVRSSADVWWDKGVAGYYFSNMMASLWLQTKAYGLHIAYPTSETTAETLHGSVRLEEGHDGEFLTFSLGTRIGGYSLCMNGSPYSYVLGSPSSCAVERSSRFVCSGAVSGASKLVFNHQSIRIYSRLLDSDERRLNALVDEIRYAGKTEADLPGGIRLSPDGTKLQVRIVVRPHGAGVSVNGADETTAVYDQWVDVGSEISLEVAPADGRRVGWGGIPVDGVFSAEGRKATFVAAMPRCISVNSFVPTHVWTGAVSGAFNVDGNWANGSAPNGEDAVVLIPEGSPAVIVPSAFNVGALHIGTLTNGNGVVSMTFQHKATNTVSGVIAIYRGSTLTHQGLTGGMKTLDTAKYGLVLAAKGDLSVCEGAQLTVTGVGFYNGLGPGASGTTAGDPGAGHASRNNVSNLAKGNTYGSILAPTSWGSGGFKPGGGVIRLMAQGVMTVEGVIEADAYNPAKNGGAGGSVWLTCATLAGYGSITANGGAWSTGVNAGSGGRIALVETEADDFSDFAGTVQAVCSVEREIHSPAEGLAGAGTVYWKANCVDEVRVGNTCAAPASLTDIPMSDDGDSQNAFRGTTLVGEKNMTFFLTADTTVFDLDLRESTAKINLNGHTLKILSREHKKGKHWGDSYENLVIENGGRIEWPISGLAVIVR